MYITEDNPMRPEHLHYREVNAKDDATTDVGHPCMDQIYPNALAVYRNSRNMRSRPIIPMLDFFIS